MLTSNGCLYLIGVLFILYDVCGLYVYRRTVNAYSTPACMNLKRRQNVRGLLWTSVKPHRYILRHIPFLRVESKTIVPLGTNLEWTWRYARTASYNLNNKHMDVLDIDTFEATGQINADYSDTCALGVGSNLCCRYVSCGI